MAAPIIRYATTDDAVKIAYWSIGDGPALIYMPNLPYTHCELEWQFPPTRNLYQRLSTSRRVIRYDGRSAGLSDRTSLDFSLDAQIRDLEAVAANANAPTFTLIGSYHTAPVAMLYASRYPERVSALILWCGYERGAQYIESPQVLATRELIDKDWHLYTETNAHLVVGWSQGPRAQIFASFMRECVTPEAVKASYAAFSQYDVSDALPAIQAPTLVLHRRGIPWLDMSVPRGIASKIPDAHLAVFEGDSGTLYTDIDETADAILGFLGDAHVPTDSPHLDPGALRTILFTDIEANTALLQRVGDATWRDILREHERTTRALLSQYGGTEIKTIGDAFMTAFGSASSAIECAIALQAAFSDDPSERAAPLRVRIGINAGEPIAEDDPGGRGDLFGTAVTTASRIQSLAEGGEILVSDVVRQLVAGKGFMFDDRGETVLRGFDDPVRIFAVRLGDNAS